jgi:uncharacterized cupredoxin-like copper-binding protein
VAAVIWPGDGGGLDPWLWLLAALFALTASGLTVRAVTVARRQRAAQGKGPASGILRQRLARGEISPDHYQHRLGVLRDTTGHGRSRVWRSTAALAVGAAVLAGISAAAAATRQPAVSSTSVGVNAACTVPAMPGHTVSVTLSDMGAMMGGGMMGGSQPGWSLPARTSRGMRMMAIAATPASVPAGTVTFRAWNAGSITHELVILPLLRGGAGGRPPGAGGTVTERGSLGEASATCAAGAGNGITAGAAGWVTLHLAPGRYELICNRPGHYTAGMYTELDVW